MGLLRQAGIGIQAGLIAGAVVAGTLFVADLAHLAPLATPIGLSSRFLGLSVTPYDSPILIQGVAIVSFGGHLALITVGHFLTFAALGALAVLLCQTFGVPLNVWTGGVYGLVFFSLVFYAAVWLTNTAGVVELPSVGTVLVVNLLAGAIAGGYCRLASRSITRMG